MLKQESLRSPSAEILSPTVEVINPTRSHVLFPGGGKALWVDGELLLQYGVDIAPDGKFVGRKLFMGGLKTRAIVMQRSDRQLYISYISALQNMDLGYARVNMNERNRLVKLGRDYTIIFLQKSDAGLKVRLDSRVPMEQPEAVDIEEDFPRALIRLAAQRK